MILILDGPNLNLLGRREPGVYGRQTPEDIIRGLEKEFPREKIVHIQSNHEGEIIDALHRYGFAESGCTGIVLNAGAYTHTSLAIADAIRAIDTPVVEVHLSNVAAREPIRHTSLIAPACVGTVAGFGARSYSLALYYLASI